MSSEPARQAEPNELVGSILVERYRVDRLLGEGGMGRVYLAEHVLMKKPVALKVLHAEMTTIPDVVSRFEREAIAAARIDHPNVAQAMDFGRLPGGALYFVLEYVDGRSLRSLLGAGPFDVDRTLAVALQMASALVAAHQVGIVHRDLKPDNVMLVAQPDGTDRVKVLDFGIAKLTAQDGEAAVPGKTLTRVGVVMGTVGYMAPEQALGQPVNHLADMYAFGIMLYEMLSGHLPYVAADITQIITKQLTESPPPLPAHVPVELAKLTSDLLARNASDRVQSAAVLAEALDRVIRSRAVAAAPTTFIDAAQMEAPAVSGRLAVTRTTTRSTPNRATWFGAGAVGLVAVVGLVMTHTHGASTGEAEAASASGAFASAQAVVPNAPLPVPSTQAVVASAPTLPSASARALEPAAKASPDSQSSSRVVESHESTVERTGTTRTKRTKNTRVTEERTVKRTHRRTGPGGIYIPPPSQWFK
jgi:serine/threonine-protein kinase